MLIVGEPRGAIGQVLLVLTARSARAGAGQSMQDVGKIAGEWRRGCAQFAGSGYKAAWWRCNRWTLSSSCSRKGRRRLCAGKAHVSTTLLIFFFLSFVGGAFAPRRLERESSVRERGELELGFCANRKG